MRDLTSPTPVRCSCWIDDAPCLVLTPEFGDRLVEVGYRGAALMLDTLTPGWDPRYGSRELALLQRGWVRDRDLSLTLTVWPLPHRETLAEMFRDLEWMLPASGAAALEVELEGLMRARVAREYGWNIRDAKLTLVDGLLRLRERQQVRLKGTTHPAHPEAQPTALVAPELDLLFWQPYATRHDAQGRLVAWDGRYGPAGRAADINRLAALSHARGQRFAFANALWDQHWPGHTVEEALGLSAGLQLAVGPEEIRDWSSGRTVGRFRDVGLNPRLAAWRRAQLAAGLYLASGGEPG